MEGSDSKRIYSQRNHFLLFYRAKARVSTENEVFCGNHVAMLNRKAQRVPVTEDCHWQSAEKGNTIPREFILRGITSQYLMRKSHIFIEKNNLKNILTFYRGLCYHIGCTIVVT